METYGIYRRRYSGVVLGFFLTVSVGIGALVGIVTKPGYAVEGVLLPWYFPPPWLVPSLLLIFYIASAIAAWRIWLLDDTVRRYGLLVGCAVQLALNLIWSPLFFLWQLHLLAFPLVVLAFGIVVSQLRRVARLDRSAAKVLRFCLACISYVLCLNAATIYLNL